MKTDVYGIVLLTTGDSSLLISKCPYKKISLIDFLFSLGSDTLQSMLYIVLVESLLSVPSLQNQVVHDRSVVKQG